ncbi:MAG: 7TM diverse intracellular signaling domain-containing protein [Chitinophagaceae bacterium]
MRQWLIFCYLLLDCTIGIWAQPQFYLYKDSSLNASAATVWNKHCQAYSTKLNKHYINLGFTTEVVWLIVIPDSTQAIHEPVLQLGDPHLNKVFIYRKVENETSLVHVTGDYYRFSQRPIATTHTTFPIEGSAPMLVRINKCNEHITLYFRITSYHEAVQSDSNQTAVYAFFGGIIMLMLVFGLYLFAMQRQLVYLFFVLYALNGYLWVLTDVGIGFQYLWPNWPWFASRARPVMAVFAALLFVQYLKQFIRAQLAPWLNSTIRTFCYILVAMTAIAMLFPYEWNDNWLWRSFLIALPLLTICSLLAGIAILIVEIRKNNQLATFFLLAHAPTVVSSIVTAIFLEGGFNDTNVFIIRYGLLIGCTLQMLLLTLLQAYVFIKDKQAKQGLELQISLQQRENTKKLLSVLQQERFRIADQLHDIAGSLLSAAKLNLSSYKKQIDDSNYNTPSKLFDQGFEALQAASDTVRTVSHALSPIMLEQVGFKVALEKAVALFNANHSTTFQAVVVGCSVYKQELREYYGFLYNIIFELLNNEVKHAKAQHVLLQVIELEDGFSIVLEDDGIGFDYNPSVKKATNTHGLAGIQYKVQHFGGVIEIEHNWPKGIIITLEIPLPPV